MCVCVCACVHAHTCTHKCILQYSENPWEVLSVAWITHTNQDRLSHASGTFLLLRQNLWHTSLKWEDVGLGSTFQGSQSKVGWLQGKSIIVEWHRGGKLLPSGSREQGESQRGGGGRGDALPPHPAGTAYLQRGSTSSYRLSLWARPWIAPWIKWVSFWSSQHRGCTPEPCCPGDQALDAWAVVGDTSSLSCRRAFVLVHTASACYL